jgi:hypothetical protein
MHPTVQEVLVQFPNKEKIKQPSFVPSRFSPEREELIKTKESVL